MAYIETSRCVHTARFEGDGVVGLLRDIADWYKRQKPQPVLWDIKIDPLGTRAIVYHDGFEIPEGSSYRAGIEAAAKWLETHQHMWAGHTVVYIRDLPDPEDEQMQSPEQKAE